MPTLNWIGKEAVTDHHRQVPYHLLRCDKKLSVGDPGSGNLLVQGDNLLAGRILDELPGFAGKPLRPGKPAHDGPKVVYGEGSRLGAARLKREGVAFKQMPYEIKVS